MSDAREQALWVKFEVVGQSGVIVREGCDLSSPTVAQLPRGAIVEGCDERVLTQCGAVRQRIAEPVGGWVSRKLLRLASWAQDARESACVRWAVDLAALKPASNESGEVWRLLTSLISEATEREAIGKFVNFVDRKRALASRLLVRRCCSLCLELPHEDVEIERTKGRKPYLSRRSRYSPSPPCGGTCTDYEGSAQAPAFNFNVSHDGRFVVLASEPHCLTGCDVAAPEQHRHEEQDAPKRALPSDEEFLESMKGSFAEPERLFLATGASLAMSHLDEEARTRTDSLFASLSPRERLRYVWCCKEAFTKARGLGLGLDFSKIQVRFEVLLPTPQSHRRLPPKKAPANFSSEKENVQVTPPLPEAAPVLLTRLETRRFRASITVDGEAMTYWRVRGEEMEAGHVFAVARGPPSDAVDAYGGFLATLLGCDQIDKSHLDAPHPQMVLLDLRDLVPEERIAEFDSALAHDKRKFAPRRRYVSETNLLLKQQPLASRAMSLDGTPPRNERRSVAMIFKQKPSPEDDARLSESPRRQSARSGSLTGMVPMMPTLPSDDLAEDLERSSNLVTPTLPSDDDLAEDLERSSNLAVMPLMPALPNDDLAEDVERLEGIISGVGSRDGPTTPTTEKFNMLLKMPPPPETTVKEKEVISASSIAVL